MSDILKVETDEYLDSLYEFDYQNEALASEYADSLNRWRAPDQLPGFLSNLTFDMTYVNCWTNRNIFSMRKQIFSKVTTVKVLQEIIRSDLYRAQPPPFVNPCPDKTDPYLFYSVHDLAAERLRELH